MNTFKKCAISACMFVFTVGLTTNVNAAYEPSDIARIYIDCDTDINDLFKEDKVDNATGEVIEKAYKSATITVVSKEGSISVTDDKAKVKLRGNSTGNAEKKPLKIKFSKKQSPLGMDKGTKWNILANAFDKTLIRNKLCFDLADKMGLDYTVQSEFVDLYYNGDLMGSYLITEPIETGEGRVEITEDETTSDFMIELERERYEEGVTYIGTKQGIRFAVNSPEVPTDDQVKAIQSTTQKIEDAIKTSRYSEYSKVIDVDSFVNYYILSEYFKAVDFNYSSTRFYYKDGMMYAGPIWDVDLSSGNASARFYTAYDNYGKSYENLFCTEMRWYSSLMMSDEFVILVNERLKEIYPMLENLYKTNTSYGTNQIDSLLSEYGASFNRNYAAKEEGGAGWSLTYRYSVCDSWLGLEYDKPSGVYLTDVEFLRSWLEKRLTYLKDKWAGIKNNSMGYFRVSEGENGNITLRWYGRGKVNNFEIYEKVASSEWKLKQVVTGTSLEIKGLKSALKYRYKIRGYVEMNGKKLYTDYMPADKTVKFALPKVNIKTRTAKGKKLTLKWSRVKEASGYIIYIKNKGGKYKAVKVVKGNKKVKYIYKKYNSKKFKAVKIKAYVAYKGKRYF